MTSHSKRTHPRSKHELPIKYKYGDKRDLFEATVYNTSKGGMYFEPTQPLPLDSNIQIIMSNYTPVGQGPEANRVYSAQIRWCRRISATKHSLYGVGVQLLTGAHNDIFLAKVTAYILDTAISLNPNEAASVLNERPEFANGNVLNSFTDWNKEDIQNISRHFSDDKFNKDVKLGFRGTGVRRDASGFYHIEIYGDETTCRIMEEKLPFINQKSIFPISCIQIDEVDFAASAPIASQCPGGSCILQPGGSGIGVFGAWIKRKHIYGKPVGITNNHVAVECNIYPPGTEIYDEYRNKVGTVEKFIPLIKYQLESDINYVDLAWIEPENTNIVDYKIGCSATRPLGDVDLEENYINGDPEIYLCRDNSKVLKGQITAFLVTLRVGNPPQYKFAEVIQLDFGEKGDSGSLILDQNHRIGGMFFATSSSKNGLTKYGYANRWEYVKSISQINFIY